MPTHLSAGADLERVLLTAEDFLEWLDPEVSADLIDGLHPGVDRPDPSRAGAVT